MAGKHSQKSSGTPLIILIIVAVAIIGAIVAGVIFLMNGGLSGLNGKEQEATQVMTSSTEPTAAAGSTAAASTEALTSSDTQKTEQATAASAESGVSRVEQKIDVQVPTDEGVPVSYFNATYIPGITAKDVYTGEEVSLREAFGSNYANSTLTFNSDGTFRDTLVSGEADSGAYVVQGDKIHATYTNDKNMKIEVTEWDNGTPVSFQVIYGDCIVYFGKD